jgi:hypothetical protein
MVPNAWADVPGRTAWRSAGTEAPVREGDCAAACRGAAATASASVTIHTRVIPKLFMLSAVDPETFSDFFATVYDNNALYRRVRW